MICGHLPIATIAWDPSWARHLPFTSLSPEPGAVTANLGCQFYDNIQLGFTFKISNLWCPMCRRDSLNVHWRDKHRHGYNSTDVPATKLGFLVNPKPVPSGRDPDNRGSWDNTRAGVQPSEDAYSTSGVSCWLHPLLSRANRFLTAEVGFEPRLAWLQSRRLAKECPSWKRSNQKPLKRGLGQQGHYVDMWKLPTTWQVLDNESLQGKEQNWGSRFEFWGQSLQYFTGHVFSISDWAFLCRVRTSKV